MDDDDAEDDGGEELDEALNRALLIVLTARLVKLSQGFKTCPNWSPETARRAILGWTKRFGCPLWWVWNAVKGAEARYSPKDGRKAVWSDGYVPEILTRWSKGISCPGEPPTMQEVGLCPAAELRASPDPTRIPHPEPVGVPDPPALKAPPPVSPVDASKMIRELMGRTRVPQTPSGAAPRDAPRPVLRRRREIGTEHLDPAQYAEIRAEMEAREARKRAERGGGDHAPG